MKLKLATTSLCGCFGCHMSFLDIDERLLQLVEQVEFDRSGFTDMKHCGPCDVGLIEGGVCNSENVHVLKAFRESCDLLVAFGACAVNGGVPAQRNHLNVSECLQYAYCQPVTPTLHSGIPNDPELPLLLDKVRPINEIVRVDYFLPGCPPSGDTIWQFLTSLINGHVPRLPYNLLKFD